MKLGSSDITTYKLGSTSVDALYLGATKLWPTASRDAVPMSALNDTVINNTRYKYGSSSLYLDRYNTEAGITNDTPINMGTGDFTIECWANADTFVNPFAVCYIGTDAFYLRNQAIAFFKGSATYGSTTLALDTWHHLAWVKSAGTLYMYANGSLEASVALTNDYSSATLKIGYKGTNDQEFDGWIDEFRVSSVARYTSGFTPPTGAFTNDADTLLLLHFEGTSGTQTFTDDNTQEQIMPILKKYLDGAWVPVTGGTPGADGADGTDGQGVPTGGTTGQVLSKVDGTDYNTTWVDQSGGATTIDDLTDVDTSTVAPTDGQALVWDGTALKWEPGTIAGGGASTGDWVFTDNVAAHTDGYSYTTTRPYPYALRAGNGPFNSDWTNDTTNGHKNAAFNVVQNYDLASNGARFYALSATAYVNNNVPNGNDRGRAMHIQQIETGETNSQSQYSHRALNIGHEWDTTSYTDSVAGAKLMNQVGAGTYITTKGDGDVGYSAAFMAEHRHFSSGTIDQAVGVAFQARQTIGQIDRYYALYNAPYGSEVPVSSGNTNQVGIEDGIRQQAGYYFIRNDDNFARNRLGMITTYHEEAKKTTISSNFSGTIGKITGGDLNFYGNTAMIDLQADCAITGFVNLYSGESVNGSNKYAADTFTFIFTQDSTGGRAVTLPTGSAYKYANGNTTIGTTANATTIVTVTQIDPTLLSPIYLISVSPEFVGS